MGSITWRFIQIEKQDNISFIQFSEQWQLKKKKEHDLKIPGYQINCFTLMWTLSCSMFVLNMNFPDFTSSAMMFYFSFIFLFIHKILWTDDDVNVVVSMTEKQNRPEKCSLWEHFKYLVISNIDQKLCMIYWVLYGRGLGPLKKKKKTQKN